MDNNLVQSVDLYIKANISEQLQAMKGENAEEKLSEIFKTNEQNYGQEDYNLIAQRIQSFANANDVQRRKLHTFCLDFVDPTVQKNVAANGEEIQLHSYLHDDDLHKLYQFVNRHKADNTFSETVYKIMDKRGIKKNSQVYSSVFMSRKDFSRAINPKYKSVSKQNVWHIIIGLKCSLEEADEVLFSAGYTRRKNVFDLIMEYFIKQRNYNIVVINEVLNEFGQKMFTLDIVVKDKDPF